MIWPNDLVTPLVRDSKKYTRAAEREQAYEYILEHAIAYGVAYAEPEDIDTINIYQAVMSAMHQALRNTSINPQHILVHGDKFRPFQDQKTSDFTSFTTVISGDNTYYSIAAASVLAKVEHDRYIRDMCYRYPDLGSI